MDVYNEYKQKYIDLKNQIGGTIYSYIYVFNKLKNIIESISYADFNKLIHVYVNDKLLENIAKKNNKAVINTIKTQTNYKKKFYHISINEFKYPFENTDDNHVSYAGNDTIYENPMGIWMSPGTLWQKYVGNEPSMWSLATYIYEIEPELQNVLFITDIAGLKEFINKYKKSNPKMSDMIDWKKVKKTFDGLIISPYLGKKIWGKYATKFGYYGPGVDSYINEIIGGKWKKNIFFTAEWYRHWEEASGVIWKPHTGIKSIKLIKKIKLSIKQ